MKYIYNKNFTINEKAVVCIGAFDGIHLGHKKIIDIARTFENKKIVILSFNPNPNFLLQGDDFKTILSYRERQILLEQLEIDFAVDFPYDEETRNTNAIDFLNQVLLKNINSDIIICGKDFKFGNGGEGTTETIEKFCSEYNKKFISVDLLKFNDEKLSSRNLRTMLKNSNIEDINIYLAKPYFITGIVIHGKELGRTINTPTINILPNKNKLLPKNGVYKSYVFIDNKKYISISNVGYNPTVKSEFIIFETHIVGYLGDLYGQEVTVYLEKFLRPEIKFNNLNELKVQLEKDKKMAMEI
ncbi:MAG: bifunctional riboflavin kinase/FAD synthetase [Lachnospirales bacterium]